MITFFYRDMKDPRKLDFSDIRGPAGPCRDKDSLVFPPCYIRYGQNSDEYSSSSGLAHHYRWMFSQVFINFVRRMEEEGGRGEKLKKILVTAIREGNREAIMVIFTMRYENGAAFFPRHGEEYIGDNRAVIFALASELMADELGEKGEGDQ